MTIIASPTTVEEIDRLIAVQAGENEELEFKQALATSDGSPDAWMNAQDRIGKVAKRELAKELIAFANTRGGTLILGIGEDAEKRAATKHLLPKCRDLADRLGQSIATSVDPMLTSLQAWGVEADTDGSGFVVFRVPASYRAPHRDRDERECYRRIGDRSEPMDMRSIHDLVLQRSRSSEDIRSALDGRSSMMKSRAIAAPFKLPDGRDRTLHPCLIRATAIPLEPLSLDDIMSNKTFEFIKPGLSVGKTQFQYIERGNWSPILRGIRTGDDRAFHQRTVLATGLVETTCDQTEYASSNISPPPVGFPMEWIMQTAANTILMAAALRMRLERPDLEFNLDFEWRFPEGAHLLMPDGRYWSYRMFEAQERAARVDFMIPPNEQLGELLSRVERDVLSSFGTKFDFALLPYDMSAALTQMTP